MKNASAGVRKAPAGLGTVLKMPPKQPKVGWLLRTCPYIVGILWGQEANFGTLSVCFSFGSPMLVEHGLWTFGCGLLLMRLFWLKA